MKGKRGSSRGPAALRCYSCFSGGRHGRRRPLLLPSLLLLLVALSLSGAFLLPSSPPPSLQQHQGVTVPPFRRGGGGTGVVVVQASAASAAAAAAGKGSTRAAGRAGAPPVAGGGGGGGASSSSSSLGLAGKTGKEINQAIVAREEDAGALLDLVLGEEEGGSKEEGGKEAVLAAFDKVNCATFVNRLSKATAAQRRQQQQQQGERQQALFEARVAAGVAAVLRRTTQLLPECDARQLANVMNGLGKLGYSPIATAATTKTDDDDGAGGDGLAFLRAFRETARREVGRFAPQELANTLHGVAILSLPLRPLPNPPSSKRPSHHNASNEKEKEEEAARLVWAEVDALVDILVGEALPALLSQEGNGSGSGSGAVHNNNNNNSQQQQPPAYGQRMTSQHVANILYALGRLNHHRHPHVLTALLTHITADGSRVFFPPPNRDPLPQFPQHLANSLNALCRLREGRRRAMSKLSKPRRLEIEKSEGGEGDEAVAAFVDRCLEVCLSSQFAHFRSRDLSAALNSLLRLGLSQPPAGLVSAVRERCYAVMDETNTLDISLILNALARLRDGRDGKNKSKNKSKKHQTQEESEGERNEEEEATEALVVALLHRLLHDLSPQELDRSLTPQGIATTINAASRLLPEAAAPSLSFETLEHKRRLYRPLMLRACDLLPRMDAQGLALTILGLGRLSEGAAGTREPIVSKFLEASLPLLPSFGPRHLSAALHGLALFRRPPPVAFLDRVREVALPRLPEFTAQQLVLTIHGMAQLGYHPGPAFLAAWAPALCQQMHTHKTKTPPSPSLLLLDESATTGDGYYQGEDPLQNLSLAFVALAILQSPPPECLWAEAQALLLPQPSTPSKHQHRTRPLRLIDVSSLLWSLAALDFPSQCPPAVMEGLLTALKTLLPPAAPAAPPAAAAAAAVGGGEEKGGKKNKGGGGGGGVGVIDKQAASQLKQFAMAVDLLLLPLSSSSMILDPRSPLWAETRVLIEERAWQPFDKARHRRRTREERARAALAASEEGRADIDDIITSPVQLEVEGLLSELGFPHEAEVEMGPYTLDMLLQDEHAAAPPVVIEVDGASHFFANLELEASSSSASSSSSPAEGDSNHHQQQEGGRGKAPRGQTALKRRILSALVQRGMFGGAVIVTTDEWAAAAKDGEGGKRALLSGKLAAVWEGTAAAAGATVVAKAGATK